MYSGSPGRGAARTSVVPWRGGVPGEDGLLRRAWWTKLLDVLDPAEPDRGARWAESGEMLQLLVEAVQDYAIFMLDPDGRVASWNAGAQRIKGWTAEEIVGQHFRVFYPAEQQESRHPEHELEVALREGHYEEEGWRVRKDGSTLLGPRHDHRGPRPRRAARRLRQGHPRHHRALLLDGAARTPRRWRGQAARGGERAAAAGRRGPVPLPRGDRARAALAGRRARRHRARCCATHWDQLDRRGARRSCSTAWSRSAGRLRRLLDRPADRLADPGRRARPRHPVDRSSREQLEPPRRTARPGRAARRGRGRRGARRDACWPTRTGWRRWWTTWSATRCGTGRRRS